jgi:hypothetical protein
MTAMSSAKASGSMRNLTSVAGSTVTVDLWSDFGEFTLTGIAPTAMGGPALFDRATASLQCSVDIQTIELLSPWQTFHEATPSIPTDAVGPIFLRHCF